MINFANFRTTWHPYGGVMGAVCCMILVDDTFYYPLLSSNSNSELSGLIQGLRKYEKFKASA